MEKIQKFYNSLNDKELIECYNKLLINLKSRKIIRTNNLVGDLGEFIAVTIYNSTPNLPNLVMASSNETAYDACQADNVKIKYAIKSISGKMTGTFWGLEHKDSSISDRKIFDYVIIVKFNKNYEVENVYEIDWKSFLILKSWHSTTKAWKINLNKKMIKLSKIITPSKTK